MASKLKKAPRTKAKSERTRQRVLDAAAGVFSEHGYAAASMVMIAEAAEMEAGSLYYHFRSKEELAFQVLSIGVKRARAAVEEVAARFPEDPVRAFEEAVHAHLTVVLDLSAYTSANIRIYGQVPEDQRQRHRAEQRRYVAVWREIIDSAVASGQLRADVHAGVVRQLVLGAMNWSIEWYDPEGPLTPEDVSRQLTQMVFRGLRKS